jgi:hypothetical protein
VKEATFGVQPATPAFKNLRITGSGLSFGPVYAEGKELRSDRALQDLLHVANQVGGTLPMQVSWRSLDDLLEYLMESNWVRTPARDNNGTAASVVTAVSATTGIFTIVTNPTPATDYNAGVFVVGQLVRASGFTTVANNGLWRVGTGGATSVTLTLTSTVDASPAAAARLKVVGFRGASADITATASGLASTALDFTTLGLVSGMWIKVGGSAVAEQFATAADNGWARINGVITATALPLDNLPTGWGVDSGATKTITVYTGDYLRNGVVEQSMTLEEQYMDLTVPEYDYSSGMGVDQLALSIKAKQPIEGTVTFKGATAVNTTTRTAGATDIVAPTNDVLVAAANVGLVADAGTPLVGITAVLSLDLTISNSLRDVPALGSMGNVDIASGTFRAKAKMSLYYASNAIRTKVLGSTASSVLARLVDATAPVGSRAYTLDFPKVKYDGGGPQVPGIDTDRTIDLTFSALAHATLAYAMHIQRTEEYTP